MSIKTTQASKLYQADLYDAVKNDNSIVCLGSERAKTFIFLMTIKNRANELHKHYNQPSSVDNQITDSKLTLIIEPQIDLAEKREQLLNDHTELSLVNLFQLSEDSHIDELNRKVSCNQIVILSAHHLQRLLENGIKSLMERTNLIIFDHAHLLLESRPVTLAISKIMANFKVSQEGPTKTTVPILVLMCSLITNQVELYPTTTTQLISSLEDLFASKCETLSDLRSLNKQLSEPIMKVIEFKSSQVDLCDWFLLVDSLLKDFCEFILAEKLETGQVKMPNVKTEIDDALGIDLDLCKISDETKGLIRDTLLNKSKQLLLIQSCLSDLLYAMHCLGYWCTKTTIHLYLTEFARLLELPTEQDNPPANLISAATTMLNCLYGRLDSLSDYFHALPHDDFFEDDFRKKNSSVEEHNTSSDFEEYPKEDIVEEKLLHGTSPQLKALLSILMKYKQCETFHKPSADRNVNTNRPANMSYNTSMQSRPLCGLVYVKRRVIAKVIALWLYKLSTRIEDFSFIKPDYIVGTSRKHRNRLAVDNFDLHHEAAIRNFRFGECNLLVTSTICEKGTDMRCNLVVSFDLPQNFADFIYAKGSSRSESGKYVVLLDNLADQGSKKRLVGFMNLELLLSNINRKQSGPDPEDNPEIIDSINDLCPPKYKAPYPSENTRNAATIWNSISTIYKYCARLPSDSFTKLSPEWTIKEHPTGTSQAKKLYYCEVRLPINSPVRQTVIGPVVANKNLALRTAAYRTCCVLRESQELDDNLLPITRDSLRSIHSSLNTETKITPVNPTTNVRERRSRRGQAIGSTRHRQYYQKMTAKAFSGPLPSSDSPCFLYKFSMILTCPIPDEQNRRGRRVVDPAETVRNFAIVCSRKLPKICSFPVFTRSGEVLISLELIDSEFYLTPEQIENLKKFHEFTFSKVLRLKRYPIRFEPEKSSFAVLLAPVLDMNPAGPDKYEAKIDWEFVDKIVKLEDCHAHIPSEEERLNFKFNYNDYVDAVVIPWYRTTDILQFAYYVAEICSDLTPNSPFPDETSGYKTFTEYYETKYNLKVYHSNQPVLDVDHTSARLNLLTPRYVNRKGITLPSSTAKTRRESRESLVQKQLLIPELCSIHPFPASFWRKAVCLPCIFYRLNSLFLAEELRRDVAGATGVGFLEPPEDFKWEPLDFGWSLRDVINMQSVEDGDKMKAIEFSDDLNKRNSSFNKKNPGELHSSDMVTVNRSLEIESQKKRRPKKQVIIQEPVQLEEDFVIDHFDPTKVVIPDVSMEEPLQDWMNIKLISSTVTDDKDGGPQGWDQPIVQRDLYLEEDDQATWSDCEMEFDGEITERVSHIRCGSPSAFEASTNNAITFDTHAGDFTNSGLLSIKSSACKQSDVEPSDDDSSWSGSDEGTPENVADADIEPGPIRYGEWKDSKVQNPPLLREIFVPCAQVKACLDSDVIKAVHDNLIDQSKVPVGDDIGNFHHITSRFKSLLTVDSETFDCKSSIALITILEQIFSINWNEVTAKLDLNSITEGWYTIMQQLETNVTQTIINEPDLFADNAIDLCPVKDSMSGMYDDDLATVADRILHKPTFGELLPNRDQSSLDVSNRDTSIGFTIGTESNDEGEISESETWKNIRFDPMKEEKNSMGPSPSIILHSLTMSNASDGINLERLETVGDSFLKYSITAYLYCVCPSMHEGKLSFLRSREISNLNLYKLGLAKNLGAMMSATKFEPNDNWLAPGYVVGSTDTEAGDADYKASSVNIIDEDWSGKRREIDRALAEVPYDLLLQHSIPDKSIADCVEALIGAYLTASGSRAAILFMQWLGLKVIPSTFDLSINDNQEFSSDKIWRWLKIPPSPLIVLPASIESLIEPHVEDNRDMETLRKAAIQELDWHYYSGSLDAFEKSIGYTFDDRAYLIQAFTHNSYYENRITDCHQRLEFLGDALLDYLITRYLFEDPKCHSPGTLTDLRSALVNNTFFASLAVKYNFHKYLKYISDELFHVIDGFVRRFQSDAEMTTKGYTLLIAEGESEYAEDIEVPKALGDVFESVAGAIYLDSGMSLDTVWQVYFRMMRPEIDYFRCHVPKSPIRELLESMPQNVRFSPSDLAPDRKHRVIAEVFGLGRFIGVGRNKHSAKCTAAKRALRALKLKNSKMNQDRPELED